MQLLGTNDAVLLASLLYSCIDLGYEWDNFGTCRQPIHRWIVVSYVCVILLRLMQVLGIRSKTSTVALGGGEGGASAQSVAADFLLDLRQQGFATRILMGCIWLVVLPFFSFWTMLGTFWLYQVINETPDCTPSVTHLWFNGFWLVLSYLWICVHAAVGIVACILERRVRRAEADLGAVADAETVSRWGNVSQLQSYTALKNDSAGLTPAEIHALPGMSKILDKCSMEDHTALECSICLNGFDHGDSIRTLPTCGHCFHRPCIDLWLLRRADCPLCKRSVRDADLA
jgi:hypothetical protein